MRRMTFLDRMDSSTYGDVQDENEKVLVCEECNYKPFVCIVHTVRCFACHCTGVDGEIKPVPIDELDRRPNSWSFVKHGEVEVNE